MTVPSQAPGGQSPKPADQATKSIVVAGGCFWCIEALFEDLKGVLYAESGYAGGDTPNPTYKQVCSGTTGHAEVVKVTFDPRLVSAEDLLRLFFVAHDPTSLNRQGPDIGTQYRSAIFYSTREEREMAERILNEMMKSGLFDKPIVTSIEPLKNYTRAEEYHQDYFAKYEKATPQERANMNAPYCAAYIAPKVAEFRKKHADKLKR